jgi:hypothetical protein
VLPPSGGIPGLVGSGAPFPGAPVPAEPGSKKRRRGKETSTAKDEDDRAVPLYRSLGAIIGAGLLVVAGVAALLFNTVLRPAPVVIEGDLSVIPLPTPVIDAVVPDSPTDFVAALPATTLTFALTGVEAVPNTQRAIWPERYAEAWYLTYSDGSGATMTVDAYQHYKEDAAIAAFEALWAEQEAAAEAAAGIATSPDPAASPDASAAPNGTTLTERSPVMSGDTQVGESFQFSASITEGEEGSEITRDVTVIVWRNLTAVFIMTADPAQIGDLFLEYGL